MAQALESAGSRSAGTTGRVPPGPRGRPLLGSGPDFQRDMLGTLLGAWREYGDVVRFRLFGRFMGYLLANPAHIKYVLQDHHRNYTKVAQHMGKLEIVLGKGIITSEGDLWRRQRRMIQPGFQHQRLEQLGEAMVGPTLDMLEAWEPLATAGRPVDVAAEMMHLTVRIAGRALFSVDVADDADTIARAVAEAVEFLNRRILGALPLPEWLPLPAHRRVLAARRAIDAIVMRMVEKRRRSGLDAGDLLSLLMHARDEETGRAMDEGQLRDEVVSLFLAGHETTAIALSWTWYLLSRHPEAGRRLRAELAAVLSGRPPTVADLARLPYTLMVVQEAMRLYPPVWGLSRQPIADDEIGGYHLPAGSAIFMVPYLTHRHPAFWDNPEGFDPERFSTERAAGWPRYAYFPFGGGPRQCIGSGFGLMEAQLVLATVAQRFHLDLVPGHPITPAPTLTLRPKHGVLVTLRPV